MEEREIDNTNLRGLIAKGEILVDDLKNALENGVMSDYHYDDVVQWQDSAIEHVQNIDKYSASEVSRLNVMQNRYEMLRALSSTILALKSVAGDSAASGGRIDSKTIQQNSDCDFEANDIFVVHGHDEAMKQTVARFISDLGLTPIVLHEQPNRGQTIIEKFEDNAARAGFAVVLMSPDDFGGSVSNRKKTQPRARQNVIVELGYFTGTLGRGRVCVLKSRDVEIPSDYLGVAYNPFDTSGAWKLKLAAELKAAGYEIDLSKILT